ncbi:Ribosome-recycling factor chloroplastic [Bienertia sinuspersici]
MAQQLASCAHSAVFADCWLVGFSAVVGLGWGFLVTVGAGVGFSTGWGLGWGIRWWWGLGWGYSATVEGLGGGFVAGVGEGGGMQWWLWLLPVAVRNIRRDALKAYEKLEKEKKLSEDNVKDLSADLQVLSGLKSIVNVPASNTVTLVIRLGRG